MALGKYLHWKINFIKNLCLCTKKTTNGISHNNWNKMFYVSLKFPFIVLKTYFQNVSHLLQKRIAHEKEKN